MDQWLPHWDYKILELINQTSSTDWQDQFFPWITDLNKSPYFLVIVIPLLLFFFIKKYKRAGITYFLFLILSLACNDFVGNQVKKHYLRPRPFQNMEIKAIQKSPADSKSFYSNHASNSFTFATYTAAFLPVAQIPLFVLAAVIAYSRVYNGVHYPSDVLVGIVVGLMMGFAFSQLAKWIITINKKDST